MNTSDEAHIDVPALEGAIAAAKKIHLEDSRAVEAGKQKLADAKRVQAEADLRQRTAGNPAEIDVPAFVDAIAAGRKYGVDGGVVEAAEQKLAEAKRVQAEAELRAAQALDGQLDLERLERAITAARTVGVADGTVQTAEQKLSEVRGKREAAAAVLREAHDQSPATMNLERLAGAISEARAAGVDDTTLLASEQKLEQVRTEREAAAQQLERAQAGGAAELNVAALADAVLAAKEAGVNGGVVEAAKQKLAEAKRVQAEAELRAAQALDGRLDLARLERAIIAARAAEVADSTVQAAEQKLSEVRGKREAAAAALREVVILPLSSIDADTLDAKLGAAKAAGVDDEDMLAQAEEKLRLTRGTESALMTKLKELNLEHLTSSLIEKDLGTCAALAELSTKELRSKFEELSADETASRNLHAATALEVQLRQSPYAVCIIGYDELPDEKGKGKHPFYLIRSAVKSPDGAITYFNAQHRRRGFEALHKDIQPALHPRLPPKFPVAHTILPKFKKHKENRTDALEKYLIDALRASQGAPPTALSGFLGLKLAGELQEARREEAAQAKREAAAAEEDARQQERQQLAARVQEISAKMEYPMDPGQRAGLGTEHSVAERKLAEWDGVERARVHKERRANPVNELHSQMLQIADKLGGLYDLDLRNDKGTKFTVDPRTLVTGMPAQAASGVEHYMNVPANEVRSGMAGGLDAIRCEIEQYGSPAAKECMEYVLDQAAGSSKTAFQGGLLRDCDKDGNLLSSRMNPDGSGMRLADFVNHPDAKRSNVDEPEVASMRICTPAAIIPLPAVLPCTRP